MMAPPFLFVPGSRPPAQPGAEALLFAFRRRELLVTGSCAVPTARELEVLGVQPVRRQYLGRLGERHCYSAQLDEALEPPSGLVLRDLHKLFGILDEPLHAVAGRAVQIVEWERTHQFCGACGQPTVASEKDRSRECPDCRLPMYPRLAPAAIVAVERGDEILLGRSAHFPPRIFSVLAGFVEPGESVEEAVVREVWEETRIIVDDVRYFGSQPWPFPNSLMLGFRARYARGEIDTTHDDDVDQAAWFHADAMPKLFPGNASISQWLIHDFLTRHRPSP